MIAYSLPSTYSKQVRRAIGIALALNCTVVVIELVAGVLSHSLALLGDGLNTSIDVLSNVAGLIVVRIAAKAPDDDHPYGHRKIETLASYSITVLLGIAFYEIVSAAIQRLASPGEAGVSITPLTVVSRRRNRGH